MSTLDFSQGLAWYFVFLYSTTLHEAAHAWAAMRLGDSTAERAGQVTLDPIPHLVREPVGMAVVPILSWFLNGGGWMMGWASAPYDREWAMRYPRRAAWMAAAGPLANVALLVVSILLIRLGIWTGRLWIPEAPGLASVVVATGGGRLWELGAMLVSISFSLQVVLVAFNLLPVPPLDGSAMVQWVLPEAVSRKYQELLHNPTYQMVGMLIAWKLSGYVVGPLFAVALRFAYF
jgi:Zn-dependent protease